MVYVRFLKEKRDGSSKESQLGGKGSSLLALSKKQFMVPDGFVVTLDAFYSYLSSNRLMSFLDAIVQGRSPRERFCEMRNAILSGEMPVEVVRPLNTALARLDAKCLAVRSSAVMEDTKLGSFAGVYETVLCVHSETDRVLASIKKCWVSLFGERALGYLIRKQLPIPKGMAVVIQEMVQAEVAGVTLTENPMDKSELLVEAAYGLGTVIADGLVEPDRFTLTRKTLDITNAAIGDKVSMQVCRGGGLVHLRLPTKKARQACLTEARVKDAARASLSVARYFGSPQDVEWCSYGKRIWILQSRPICPPTGG